MATESPWGAPDGLTYLFFSGRSQITPLFSEDDRRFTGDGHVKSDFQEFINKAVVGINYEPRKHPLAEWVRSRKPLVEKEEY
jgi:hypothetical protein